MCRNVLDTAMDGHALAGASPGNLAGNPVQTKRLPYRTVAKHSHRNAVSRQVNNATRRQNDGLAGHAALHPPRPRARLSPRSRAADARDSPGQFYTPSKRRHHKRLPPAPARLACFRLAMQKHAAQFRPRIHALASTPPASRRHDPVGHVRACWPIRSNGLRHWYPGAVALWHTPSGPTGRPRRDRAASRSRMTMASHAPLRGVGPLLHLSDGRVGRVTADRHLAIPRDVGSPRILRDELGGPQARRRPAERASGCPWRARRRLRFGPAPACRMQVVP